MFLKGTFLFSLLFSTTQLFAVPQWAHWISGASSWKDSRKLPQLSSETKKILQKALEDLPGVIDTHTHLVCKESKNGCYVPPSLFSPYEHPISYFKTQIMMSALGVRYGKEVDRQVVQRLDDLLLNFPEKKYRSFLFAYTASYDAKTHEKVFAKTGLEVPNTYLDKIVEKYPDRYTPVYSLHPFQANLEEEFQKRKKLRFLKLLPNSMHVSPDDENCDLYFKLIAEHNVVLITHAGDEHSIEGGGIRNEYGNPLLYEKWLKKYPKLRIVFAHVGNEGKILRAGGEKVPSFDLVIELLKKYPKQTFADLSGFSLHPSLAKNLPTLLHETGIHPQLFYGSDYPLVSIKPLLFASLGMMYYHGLLGSYGDFLKVYRAAMEIYQYNPLLASVLVMRSVSFEGKRFPKEIFYANARRLF